MSAVRLDFLYLFFKGFDLTLNFWDTFFIILQNIIFNYALIVFGETLTQLRIISKKKYLFLVCLNACAQIHNIFLQDLYLYTVYSF